MLKFFGFVFLFLSLSATSLAAWFFLTLPQAHKINECLTTTLYKVSLCKQSPSYSPIQSIAKVLKDAVVISEDSTFYQHSGFDWFEIEKSYRVNKEAKAFKRGGSTLTQQLAKNVFLSNEKTYLRKLREAVLTYQIESTLSKDEILEKYLNVVEWGPNLYGVGPASQFYFKKNPSSLHVLEAAFLTYLLPSPRRYSQVFNNKQLTPFARNRILNISQKLFQAGRINEYQFRAAQNYIDDFPWNNLSEAALSQLRGESRPTDQDLQHDLITSEDDVTNSLNDDWLIEEESREEPTLDN